MGWNRYCDEEYYSNVFLGWKQYEGIARNQVVKEADFRIDQ
jgi:hypothetical protein